MTGGGPATQERGTRPARNDAQSDREHEDLGVVQ
ncbi:hypothetical protein M768_08985 [Cellulosimicrobium cellulans F16]|uniref:Uncharacterized protein n=1 Tax=Cellulosimicrobium cellulans F16 TaxID=1350482 RepID=A0A0M0F9T6_CELCE|nr:hypothetical protein M768_08985 [Cellulosimicrobium cellulans F16]